jgi:hypothetical protein
LLLFPRGISFRRGEGAGRGFEKFVLLELKLFHNYSIIPFAFHGGKLFQNTSKWNRDYSIWRPWSRR